MGFWATLLTNPTALLVAGAATVAGGIYLLSSKARGAVADVIDAAGTAAGVLGAGAKAGAGLVKDAQDAIAGSKVSWEQGAGWIAFMYPRTHDDIIGLSDTVTCHEATPETWRRLHQYQGWAASNRKISPPPFDVLTDWEGDPIMESGLSATDEILINDALALESAYAFLH